MMNTACSDSDTSDEDYNPTKESNEVLSEEESNNESEGNSENEEDNKKDKKRGKTRKGVKKVKKSPVTEVEEKVQVTAKVENDKKRVDDLWADFMKDTGFKPRAELLKTDSSSKETQKNIKTTDKSSKLEEIKKEEKIKITEVFEFAGEEVRVEKEISAHSAEAKSLENISGASSSPSEPSKKPKVGGLSSVLNQIGKKGKISTLEKTKLDWEKFKKDEKIEDELKAYGKSKDGYLERQDFLQRADLRQFEIEKSARNTLRSNRVNNVP